jgi:uncharacterized protein (DUF1697 family)
VALVVLLRGVNVGGHRRFQPRVFASRLKHLDVESIGAAGTFVVRRPITRTQLRAEFARRLPFETAMVICDGREIVRLLARAQFANESQQPGVVRFVSVLARPPRVAPSLPLSFPSRGKWLLQILSRDNRFVCGHYRRHLKVIGYLGAVDRVFGVPVTTRNWNTINAIARVLHEPVPRRRPERPA